MHVDPSTAATVPLALATIREWSTQSTVSVLVNVTSNSGATRARVPQDHWPGPDPSAVAERCGSGGSAGQPAATVIELRGSAGTPRSRSTTHTRMVPCLRRDGDGNTTAVFALRAGTLSALSFT